jgi:cell shape-determining protein MreC
LTLTIIGGEHVSKLMMEVSKPTSYSHLVSYFFGILTSFVAYNDGKSKRFSVVSPFQLGFDVVVHYCNSIFGRFLQYDNSLAFPFKFKL